MSCLSWLRSSLAKGEDKRSRQWAKAREEVLEVNMRIVLGSSAFFAVLVLVEVLEISSGIGLFLVGLSIVLWMAWVGRAVLDLRVKMTEVEANERAVDRMIYGRGGQ